MSTNFRVDPGYNADRNAKPSTSDLYLPLATKLWQGNVFTPVCQSFCSQDGYVCLWSGGVCHTPFGRQPPWAENPLLVDTYTPRQTPAGQTTPGRHTSPLGDTHPLSDTPQVDTPLADSPGRPLPWADTPPAQCMVGYTPLPQCMVRYTPLHSASWDTVNKRVVCIPLEYILVCLRCPKHRTRSEFFNWI